MLGCKITSKFFAQKEKILRNSLEFFLHSLPLEFAGCKPVFGVELEFYLLDLNSQKIINDRIIVDYIDHLQQKFNNFSIQQNQQLGLDTAIAMSYQSLFKVEREQGCGQIEVKTNPVYDIKKLCKYIDQIKKTAQSVALEKKLLISFDAQIFDNDCGSALQFSFSLNDKNDKNLLAENENLCSNIIAGMLDFVDDMMIFSVANKNDYRRFDKELNLNLHKNKKYTAPINLSYGINNRTALIRVVKRRNTQQNRIEFRLPAAGADQYLVASCLLIAIICGILQNKIVDANKKIFGNAFDSQYQLQEFIKNFDEVEKNFLSQQNFIRQKFEEFIN